MAWHAIIECEPMKTDPTQTQHPGDAPNPATGASLTPWIVLTGPPGSGKSTVCKLILYSLELGEDFHRSFDIITYYEKDATFTAEDIQKAFKELRVQVGKVGKNTHCVIEAMFYSKERQDELKLLAQMSEAKPFFIHLDAPLKVLQERVRQRKGKHDMGKPLTPGKIEELQKLFSGFESDLKLDTHKLEPEESLREIIKLVLEQKLKAGKVTAERAPDHPSPPPKHTAAKMSAATAKKKKARP